MRWKVERLKGKLTLCFMRRDRLEAMHFVCIDYRGYEPDLFSAINYFLRRFIFLDSHWPIPEKAITRDV